MTLPNQVTLPYVEQGDPTGVPVLLLHGITASGRYWTPRIRDLATRFRLLIPDLPGFGDRPSPSSTIRRRTLTAMSGQSSRASSSWLRRQPKR
ncbi:MAG: alpha/beta hydrolase [Aquincola sp.]|nr:alpha/beta hydrolase [Aquincola sp.]